MEEVQTAYGINPLPITFLIDKEGTVIKSHTGQLTEEMVHNFMKQNTTLRTGSLDERGKV